MMDFEDQLRSALARKEPPAGFAERVAAESIRRDGWPSGRRNFWKTWAAGCIAASLLAGAFEMRQVESRRERDKGQAARTQLLQALRITGAKLHHIQQKVEDVSQ
ncbi:MAG: hypothetical protein M3Y27_05790 [Acidobacteriota bacterium]|nr:hypothetical protein [Acidobacteriota bacterium]